MPRWLLITIITILGLAGAFGAYLLTTQQLDREHERYIRGLVVTYGQQQNEAGTSPNEEGAASSTDAGTATSSSPLQDLEQSIVASGTAVNLTETTDLTSSYLDFSVEIGSITIDEVLFEVGMSWQNEDRTETYTVTKIIQKTSGVDLFYEKDDGTTYVFQLTQNPAGGGFTIVGAPPTITVSVDTDPENDNDDDGASQNASTTQSTGNNNQTNTTTDNGTPNTPAGTTTTTPEDDGEPSYVVVYSAPTSTPTSTESAPNPDPDPTPDPGPDIVPDPDEEPTSTSTEPVSLTSPTSTPSEPTTTTSTQSLPYNDGTHQFKADAQYVPYTPPLYDRYNDSEVGIAP